MIPLNIFFIVIGIWFALLLVVSFIFYRAGWSEGIKEGQQLFVEDWKKNRNGWGPYR